MDLNSLRTKWSSKDAAETGRIIFMAVPIGKRPDWAGAILLYCAGEDGLSDELATIVDLSYSDTKWEWISAREHFNSIRDKILAIENSVRTADIHRSLILHIGEIAAKVIYNSSGGPAPYDRESGWYMAPCVKQYAEFVGVQSFEDNCWNLLIRQPAR